MASPIGLSKFYTRVVSQTGLKPSGSVLFLHGSGMDVEYILSLCVGNDRELLNHCLRYIVKHGHDLYIFTNSALNSACIRQLDYYT